MCLVLVFLAMRAVMDIGGTCAEGGPYVVAQSCPEGATPALMLGIFGRVRVRGARDGLRRPRRWLRVDPLLAWTALFASLGWNFLDYGLFNAPEGQGIVWGWVIPGVMFEIDGLGAGVVRRRGGARRAARLPGRAADPGPGTVDTAVPARCASAPRRGGRAGAPRTSCARSTPSWGGRRGGRRGHAGRSAPSARRRPRRATPSSPRAPRPSSTASSALPTCVTAACLARRTTRRRRTR